MNTNLKFPSSQSKLCFIPLIKALNLKSTIIHHNPCLILYQHAFEMLSTILELRRTCTYLKVFKKHQKSALQGSKQLFSSSFSFFLSSFSLVSFNFRFLSLFFVIWPKMAQGWGFICLVLYFSLFLSQTRPYFQVQLI